MRSSSREEVVEAFDALDADLTRALDLSFDALTTPERLNLLERIETLRRRLPGLERPLIDELTHADPDELGGKLHWALADRLHLTRAEAKRRIDETADLRPRRRFDGQPLPPLLPTTAAAARAGHINSAHIHIIRDFWHHLPTDVLPELAANAEKHLANLACDHRPDELAKLASCLTDCLNPDGLFSDIDRTRRRHLSLGRQDADGMSTLTATLTPTARAALDAVLARWAAPGMCNPADTTPCRDGTPHQGAIDNDDRSTGQRNHDALAALATAMLASGQLGTHNGLPATIVVTTTLTELQTPPRTAHAGGPKAHTGGGTWLPMSDVLKLATQAHHYLAIFDGAKPLALYHAKRLANPAQRLLLYATERGCTHPGCTVAANCTEVHHITPYAQQPRTHADELTLRCGPHHRLLNSQNWTTRKNHNNETETIPPPHLDRGQPRTNHYHHPEKLLHETGGGNTDTNKDSDSDGEDEDEDDSP